MDSIAREIDRFIAADIEELEGVGAVARPSPRGSASGTHVFSISRPGPVIRQHGDDAVVMDLDAEIAEDVDCLGDDALEQFVAEEPDGWSHEVVLSRIERKSRECSGKMQGGGRK